MFTLCHARHSFQGRHGLVVMAANLIRRTSRVDRVVALTSFREKIRKICQHNFVDVRNQLGLEIVDIVTERKAFHWK